MTGPRVGGIRSAFRVAAFHEKPALVMVARVAHLIALPRDVRPSDVARLALLPADVNVLVPAYDRLSSWNSSRDFLARIPEQLVVARADHLGWSDWGTPDAIERTFVAMGLVPPWRVPQRATAWQPETPVPHRHPSRMKRACSAAVEGATQGGSTE